MQGAFTVLFIIHRNKLKKLWSSSSLFLLAKNAVGAQSDASTFTGGSVQWKGTEGGNGGGRGLSLHVYNAPSPPPWLARQKPPCQTKSGKMYKIMKLVAGGGEWGGGDYRLNEERLEVANHRDVRGLTKVLAPAFLA
jgi:hypothetical protein